MSKYYFHPSEDVFNKPAYNQGFISKRGHSPHHCPSPYALLLWLKPVVRFCNSLVKYCEIHSGIVWQVSDRIMTVSWRIMTRNGKDCWSREVSDVLKLLYSLGDSTGESLASNFYGGVGSLKPQPVDSNKVEKVLLLNYNFFYFNTKSGSSHPRGENDFNGRNIATFGYWMSSSWN